MNFVVRCNCWPRNFGRIIVIGLGDRKIKEMPYGVWNEVAEKDTHRRKTCAYYSNRGLNDGPDEARGVDISHIRVAKHKL